MPRQQCHSGVPGEVLALGEEGESGGHQSWERTPGRFLLACVGTNILNLTQEDESMLSAFLIILRVW